MPRIKVGKQKDANYWITQCLLAGDKTLGEIKEFLKEKTIGYAGNKGLLLRLEDLIDAGTIDKHKLKGNSYPTYYLPRQELKKTSYRARVFASYASRKLLTSPITSKHSGSKEEEFTKKMILRCGFYVMYTILQGWKLALVPKKDKQKMMKLEEWLGNAFPMPFVPTFFHLQLSKMIDPKNEVGLSKSVISYPELRKKQLKMIELTLNQLYPEEMKLCNTEIKKLKDTTLKVLDDVIEYKIGLSIKMRKKVKNKK